MVNLKLLIERLRTSNAFNRKKAIHPPLKAFADVWNFGATVDPIGDDAAIIKNGDEYLLLSCDGILPQLAEKEPFWSGYCAVLVSVSDIYAMGGKPIAVVNLLSAPDETTSVLIAEGMAEGCRKLGVPMVGGHFFPEEASGVATAILGKTSKLLRATNGKPGQSVIVALDLNGGRFKDYFQWDSTSFLDTDEMVRKLNILPLLAELDFVQAARDISNAGILGTLAMLAENSQCGAEVDLSLIPIPDSIDMETWLQIYPGYGFILTVNPEVEQQVIRQFVNEGISANVIGQLTKEMQVVITSAEEKEVFVDFTEESLVVEM